MFNFTENLTCIDESWSRLSRLKDISKWYIGETPSSMLVSKRDGRLLEDPFYNKVHLLVTHLITMKIVNMHAPDIQCIFSLDINIIDFFH